MTNNDDYDDQTKRKPKSHLNLYDIDWSFLVNAKNRAPFHRHKHINSSRYFSLMPSFCLTSVYIDENLQNRVFDYLKTCIQQYIHSTANAQSTPTPNRNLKINLNKALVNSRQIGFIKNEFDLGRCETSSVHMDYSCKYGTCARNDLNDRKQIVYYNSNVIKSSVTTKSTLPQSLDVYRQYLDLIKSEIF